MEAKTGQTLCPKRASQKRYQDSEEKDRRLCSRVISQLDKHGDTSATARPAAEPIAAGNMHVSLISLLGSVHYLWPEGWW